MTERPSLLRPAPAAAHHIARRRFSQNFLVDQSVIVAIVEAIAPKPGDNMVEIGPGPGALTRPLAKVVQALHVIEIDRDLVAQLRGEFSGNALTIHEGDALTFDFASLGPGLRIVGNLPYHISTPILFRIAEYESVLRDVHVMLQREVVERMVAAPGSSEYGRLSVMLQYRFEMEQVLEVPAAAFRPAPQVESAVVRMIPIAQAPRAHDEKVFSRVVAAAFSQRRKTLRNALRYHLDATELETLGVAPGARAQELAVASFIRIADYVCARDAPR